MTVLRAEDLAPLAAFLGRGAPATGRQEAGHPEGLVPPCWHWCLLLDPVHPEDLDDDGYLVGAPTTPGPGVTRMFAGGRVHTLAPLRLGRETTRTTELTSSVDKQGRRGPLRFVTMTSTWRQDGRTAVVDEADYVFMPAKPASGTTDADARLVEPAFDAPATGARRVRVTEPALVTFSALTANPYRIHWDKDFCARSGHDGLVIHGPLQALWMAEETFAGVDPTGTTFSYRFAAPATAPAVMTIEPHQVHRPDGVVTATSTLD